MDTSANLGKPPFIDPSGPILVSVMDPSFHLGMNGTPSTFYAGGMGSIASAVSLASVSTGTHVPSTTVVTSLFNKGSGSLIPGSFSSFSLFSTSFPTIPVSGGSNFPHTASFQFSQDGTGVSSSSQGGVSTQTLHAPFVHNQIGWGFNPQVKGHYPGYGFPPSSVNPYSPSTGSYYGQGSGGNFGSGYMYVSGS